MMAVSAVTLPDGADWSYEVKWDGYRAQAIKQGSAVSLASRNLKNITRQFPGVARAAAALAATAVVLDGEIVAIDAEGRPSFQALHHAATEGLSIVYYAFDLLHLNGRDLTTRCLLTNVALRCATWSRDPTCCCPIRCLEPPRRSPTPCAVSASKEWSRSEGGQHTRPDAGAMRGSRCASLSVRSW